MLKEAGLSEHRELKLFYDDSLQFMITSPTQTPGWAIEVPSVPAALPVLKLSEEYREVVVESNAAVQLPDYYLHRAGIQTASVDVQVTFRCGDWFYMEIRPLPKNRPVEQYLELKTRLGKYMAYIDGAAYSTCVKKGHVKLPVEFMQRFGVETGASLRCSFHEASRSIVLEAPDVVCDVCGRNIRTLIELPCKSHNCEECGKKRRRAG